MAESLVSKILNQAKGWLHDSVDEASDPSRTARQIVRDIEERITKAESGLLDVKAEFAILEGKQNAAASEAKVWEDRARNAVANNREDLARQALEKASLSRKTAAGFQTRMDDFKPQLTELERLVADLQRAKEEAEQRASLVVASAATAEAQTKAASVLAGIGSADALTARMDNVEERVARTSARAKASMQIANERSGASLTREFEALEARTSSDDIEAQLAAMKKELNK